MQLPGARPPCTQGSKGSIPHQPSISRHGRVQTLRVGEEKGKKLRMLKELITDPVGSAEDAQCAMEG